MGITYSEIMLVMNAIRQADLRRGKPSDFRGKYRKNFHVTVIARYSFWPKKTHSLTEHCSSSGPVLLMFLRAGWLFACK